VRNFVESASKYFRHFPEYSVSVSTGHQTFTSIWSEGLPLVVCTHLKIRPECKVAPFLILTMQKTNRNPTGCLFPLIYLWNTQANSLTTKINSTWNKLFQESSVIQFRRSLHCRHVSRIKLYSTLILNKTHLTFY